MNISIRSALALALSALVLTLPACKKARDAAVDAALERATGVKVDRDGNTVTVRTSEGEARIASDDGGGNLVLPASFPKDIQLPAQYKLSSVMELGGAQVLSMTTPEAMGSLFNSLSGGMERSGWTRELSAQTGDGGTLGFSKGNAHVVYYVAKNENGSTDLNINATTTSAQ